MTLLQHATLADGSRVDVRIEGRTIVEVTGGGALDGPEAVDLAGYLLLPAPAEPHAHLDKALTLARTSQQPASLDAAIAAWHRERRTLQVEDIAGRAERAALQALARGATAIRTHVDVGEGIELRAVEALLGVRKRLRELIDIQIVALSYPLAGAGEASDNRERVKHALELGADVVGGAPHIDPDPIGHMEACLALAREFGRAVDLHMDEHIRPADVDLGDLCNMVAGGDREAVTASHCVSLGMQERSRQAQIAGEIARAGVSVVSCPATNLHLQGRGIPTATPRGITALRALLDAGVTLAGGGDNVQDFFHPLGCGDPLQTAALLVLAGQVDAATAYRMVSRDARAVLGIEHGDVEVGAPAELIAVAAASLTEALATVTEDRVVIRRGRLIERTRVIREVPEERIEEG